MELKELQRLQESFDLERGWTEFPASLVYIHLVEEGYKVRGLGHEGGGGVEREFGQAFSLLLQLANMLRIDLEEVYLRELDSMKKRFPVDMWRDYMKRYKK